MSAVPFAAASLKFRRRYEGVDGEDPDRQPTVTISAIFFDHASIKLMQRGKRRETCGQGGVRRASPLPGQES